MAAKIRLKKVGRKGQAAYRVVVLDGRKPRDAKVVADLGSYDPRTNPATFEIDGDTALEWLLKGAKATRAAREILSKAGVLASWDAAKRGETVEIEAKELKPTTKGKKTKQEPEAEAVAESSAEAVEEETGDEPDVASDDTAPEEESEEEEPSS